MKKVFAFFIACCLSFFALFIINNFVVENQSNILNQQKLLYRDFPTINSYHYESQYISYTDFRNNIAHINASAEEIEQEASDLIIRIDNAEELYRFSVDVSYNPKIKYYKEKEKLTYEVIEVLLSLHYVLGNDIDYSQMRSKKFIPIGYYFETSNGNITNGAFTGIFDGRGFEIKNLNFADGSELNIVDFIGSSYGISQYYAMFTINEGIIKNLGLINPLINLSVTENIDYFANLVGLNEGTVSNVYVISNRGMCVNSYEGVSGIVYENRGLFSEGYFVGEEIIENEDTYHHPVIAINNGHINNLVYDKTLYQYQDNLVSGEETSVLKSSQSKLREGWYFYENDRYPSLMGLDEDNGILQINDAIDLVSFSKIINYNTTINNGHYNEANYELTNNIDMNEVAISAYQPPTNAFIGSFNGNNYYISNLQISQPATVNDNNYLGFFSILEGEIKNVVFSNFKIDANWYNYNYQLNIGLIAGKLSGGYLNNILINGQIDLKMETINQANIGGVVGIGNGTISNVYVEGIDDLLINGNAHNYFIVPKFHIGGIIGSTNNFPLILENVENRGLIRSISSNDTINLLKQGEMTIGGIVGYLYNYDNSHQLSHLLNNGNIEVYDLSTPNYTQYVGGIIGLSEGKSFTLNDEFGFWTNSGVVINNATENIVKAAGIAITNHEEETEFIFLENNNTFESNSFTNFNYTSLIYNLSNSPMIISQSKNNGDFIYSSYSQYISPLYYSEKNANTILRFVENKGKIKYQNVVLLDETYVSGISTSTNIDYLNVYFSGEIEIKNINSQFPLWVAGITNILSTNHLYNSLNEGNLYVYGTNSKNTYIGGLVNINYGEIKNSINYGILSTKENTIDGVGNTYAGGIATLNGGEIKDVINFGSLHFKNFEEIENAIIIDDNNANLITSFKGGVTLGGISAAIINDSYILNSVNSGYVIGISENYVRVGGIVGINSQYESSIASLIENNNSTISNVINEGIISAITKNIAHYSTELISPSFKYYFSNDNSSGDAITIDTTKGTNERPAVYSSSGGILGYGNSIICDVINRGNVSATDVAGGIIGTIFINTNDEEIINIDGAINYGLLNAINKAYYENLKQLINIDNLSNYFYDNNDFIFPQTISDIRRFPEAKRGFGGIIGRIQRGKYATITTIGGNFDSVLNYDVNIDLIGRIDQDYNFTDSMRYIQLNGGNYYSAKENDTSQVVFTGFTFYRNGVLESFHQKTITKRRETYTISDIIPNVLFSVVVDIDYYVTEEIIDYFIQGDYFSKQGEIITYKGYNYEDKTESLNIEPYWYRYGLSDSFLVSYIYIDQYNEPRITDINDSITNRSYDYGYIMWENLNVPTIPENYIIDDDMIYVDSSNLSDRFSEYEGMYVLKTNGDAFLPNNINLEKIYRLKDAIAYNSNYENILETNKEPLPEEIIYQYNDLKQVNYNENAFLLNDNIALEEIDGNGIILDDPIIDHENKTIIYEIGIDEFPSNQYYASFVLGEVNISSEAIIAANILDYSYQTGKNYYYNLSEFRNLLLSGDKPISNIVVPNIYINFGSYRGIKWKTSPIYMGKVTIYSEVALNNDIYLLDTSYTTTYDIYIILTPAAEKSNGNLWKISKNYIIVDGEYYNYNSLKNKRIYVDGQIGISFKDKNILPNNYEMDYISLYFGEQDVYHSYYDIEVIKKDDDGKFGFIIDLGSDLASGKYTLKYKFFKYGDLHFLDFYINEDGNAEIVAVTENDSNLSIINNYFKSSINFGEILDLNNITWTILNNEDNYIQKNTYEIGYLNLRVEVLGTLLSVEFVGKVDSEGFYTYNVEYVVRSEDGTQENAYIHQIIEKDFEIENIYQDNFLANIENIKILREQESNISLDFGILPYLYKLTGENHFSISYDYDPFKANNKTSGITYDCNNFLQINFSMEANPGTYLFTISYYRQSLIVKTFFIEIVKLEGDNAYLKNITFSKFPEAIREIGIADEEGNLINKSPYYVGFYENGIDYDNTVNVIKHFRINTYVSNLDNSKYLPDLISYLPLGATISRRVYDGENLEGSWTPEVDQNSSDELIEMLAADFRFANKAITYRVTSENKEKEVYYHIYITESLYNVQFVFNIYFVDNNTIIPAHESKLFKKTLLINVRNVKTDIEVTSNPVNGVNEFPQFNEVIDIKNFSTLFHFPYSEEYQFYFAPNLRGFYIFDLEISDDVNGERYDYEIEYNGDILSDVENEEGKYFYIEAGMDKRIETFNIYVYNSDDVYNYWGLNDYYDSWQ